MNTTTTTAIVAAALAVATPAAAQQHDHGQAQQAPVYHSQHQPRPTPDHSQMDQTQHQATPDPHAGHDMSEMTGLLGAYPMGRDASGTAWQPDVSSHGGVHVQAGQWRLMGHAMFNAVYD